MNKNPVIKLPTSKTERLLDLLSVAILLSTIMYTIAAWPDLAQRVPVHFNAAGEPDRWGSKSSLIFLSFLSAVMYAGMLLLRRVPHHFNYPITITPENAAEKYRLSLDMIGWMRFEIVVMFGYMQWSTIRTAQGMSAGLGGWFMPLMLAAIIGTLIYYLIRLLRQ